jgi:hypothetical protein
MDLAGNVELAFTTATFICDVSSPLAFVANPNNGVIISTMSTMSGGSYDNMDTTLVQIRIKRSDNYYWALNTWESGSGYWNNTTCPGGSGDVTWTYPSSPFPNGTFTSGMSYTIDLMSFDNALPFNNIGTYVSTCTFTFDNMGPVSCINLPANNGAYNQSGQSLSVISGTSYDATSGAGNVNMSVKDLNGGANPYFKGSGFSNATEYWITISSQGVGGQSVTWSYNQTSLFQALQDGHSYQVRVYGTDNIGNVETNISSNTFVFDVTNPTSVVTGAYAQTNNAPVTYATVPSLSGAQLQNIEYINGTAVDPSIIGCSGVSEVDYCIIMESHTINGTYEDGTPHPGIDWQYDESASTWTLYTGPSNIHWMPATAPTAYGQSQVAWQSKDMRPYWISGRWYIVKTRARTTRGT